MVVDTSALVAILFDEPAPARADPCDRGRPGPPGLRGDAARDVDGRRGAPRAAAGRELDALLRRAQAQTMDVTARHVELARSVWRRYGKGRHPAALNYGDCFSAALALATGEPLLFIGTDFTRTDIPAVVIPEPDA